MDRGDGGKRKAYDEPQGFQVKRQGTGAERAGYERSEPKIFEQPNLEYDYYGELRKQTGTDFSSWSVDQIKEFLDQRGGDYDDCKTLEQLVERAREVEINTGPAKPPAAAEDDEEYDPLEAFMSGLADETKQPTKAPKAANPDLACDDTYDIADFLAAKAAKSKAAAAAPAAAAARNGDADSDEEVYAAAAAAEAAADGMEYDENDNPILGGKKKNVDELPPLDHSTIEYDTFAKDFYEEGPELFAMDDGEVAAYRRQLEMRVAGFDAPKPIKEFNQCGFDNALMAAIKKAGYERPTAIQAQALPAALSGRDVLGIAKTGSGKTAAFVLPMLVHIMDQPELAPGAGPIGVIVAPTRELAEQIHKETRKFSKVYNLRVAAAIGGMSKYEQMKDLKAGSEVAVCTPGRLIDHIKAKACTMQRTTYLVLDEADRMFDLGFEPQVRSIVGQIRPDRQTLLFSATMPRKVERLVADALTNPITITVGVTGVANADVRQEISVVSDDTAKMNWLLARLAAFVDEGEVIIFASQRAKVESLVTELTKAGARAGAIHGDLDQHSRMSVLDAFRQGKLHVLVATDVAARGLDIKVGRTGRAGDKEGVAYTLLLGSDARFAGQLVQSLALAGQTVPKELHDLALKDSRFKKGASRNKGGKGRKGQTGGAGLGFGGGGGGGGGGSGFGGLGYGLPSRTTTGHTTFQPASTPLPPPPPLPTHTPAMTAPVAYPPPPVPTYDPTPLPPPPPLPAQPPPAAAPVAQPAAKVSIAEAIAAAKAAAARAAAGAGAAGAAAGTSGGGGYAVQPAAVPGSLPGPPPQAPMTTMPTPGSHVGAMGAPAPTQGYPPPPSQQYAPPAVSAPYSSGSGGGGDAGTGPAAGAASAQDTTAAARSAYVEQQESGREYVKQFHENRFKSNFVSSGTAGGTVNQSATVVAPKSQSAGRAIPPPPVPVTQRPMYLSAAAGGFGAGPRRGPSGPHPAALASMNNAAAYAAQAGSRQTESNVSYHNAPPPNLYGGGAAPGAPPGAPASVAAAIAAAQAIAARLAAQEPK